MIDSGAAFDGGALVVLEPDLALTPCLGAAQQPSEIRVVCGWDVGFGPREPSNVFSTDHFRKLIFAWHIGQRRGPGHGEDALVLDRHVELQKLAAVPAEDIVRETHEQPITIYLRYGVDAQRTFYDPLKQRLRSPNWADIRMSLQRRICHAHI